MPLRLHLFFDLDGTIIDSRHGIVRCFQHALDELNAAAPAESTLAQYIGSSLSLGECFLELLQTADVARMERAVAAYRRRFQSSGMFECSLYPGVGDALVALKGSGHQLHVVTAKPATYARTIAEHFGIDGHFSGLHGPELTDRHVTKAALVRLVLGANEVVPADAVVIGDRAADVIAARTNGLRSIGVTWGYGDRHELADADHIVDGWADLVACVRHLE